MKTIKRIMNKALGMLLLTLIITTILFLSCSSDDPNPNPSQTGTIKGKVTDEDGNTYPNIDITFLKGAESVEVSTNANGVYEGKTKDSGSYEIAIELPLSTSLVGNPTTTVDVSPNQPATINFVISPKPVKAHLNFGNVQLLEEIVDKDGNTPSASNELLFAKNIFDAPLGQLNAIKAPDGHQITLSEFKKAKGELLVHCNGESSTIEITLEGMIPNGTYTFWLAYLKKKVTVGERIDFANDFVNFTNPPIGVSNGTENIAIANVDGTITTTLKHNSCILTDEVALVIPILYHLNGKTFGGGHVPDAEEMVQLLVYFQ